MSKKPVPEKKAGQKTFRKKWLPTELQKDVDQQKRLQAALAPRRLQAALAPNMVTRDDLPFYDPNINPVEGILRGRYPHGHPEFTKLLIEEARLHSEKNHDYAGGGDPLGNFDRCGEILKLYPGLDFTDPAVVAAHWMLKQFDAYLWMKAQRTQAKAEGSASRLRDISVYSKIIRIIEGR